MRVLLISQEYPPETHWGGIGTYAGTVAPELVRLGAEVHVLSVVRGQPNSDVVRDGVHVHRRPLRRIPRLGQMLRFPETVNRLTLALNAVREMRRLAVAFDVVECPEWSAEGLFIGRRRLRPLVVRVHVSAREVFPYLGGSMTLDRRLAMRLEDASIRAAQVVTGTAAQVHVAAADLGLPAEVCHPIIYPVRPREMRPFPTEGPPTVVFVGRFERRKGPDTLIRAMPYLLARVPQARAVFLGRDTVEVGCPSVVASLRALADDLGVSGAVEIIDDWGSADVVAETTARALACAMPSRWESMGFVAAEASLLGRPVLASDIPGLAAIVEDGKTGRLLDPDDPRAWGEAAADLLSDPVRAREMGEAAALLVRARCDPAIVAAETFGAYEEAIRRFAKG